LCLCARAELLRVAGRVCLERLRRFRKVIVKLPQVGEVGVLEARVHVLGRDYVVDDMLVFKHVGGFQLAQRDRERWACMWVMWCCCDCGGMRSTVDIQSRSSQGAAEIANVSCVHSSGDRGL
jgi:hypothetical protein